MGASASTYFNPVPLFILFREAIEASIVVSVLLTFVNRSNPALKGQVWWGVGLGVAISLILGAIFAILYYTFQQNLFQGGQAQFIFKGVIAWVASVFITYLSFAMLRYKGWEDKWARKLTGQKTLEMSAQSFSSPAVASGVSVSNDAPIAKLDDACCNIELGQDAMHVSQVDPELGIIKVNPSPSSHLQSPPASALPGDKTKLDRDALCCHEETVAQIEEPAMKATDAATELVVLPDTADIFDAQKSDSCQRSWVSRLREGKGFFGHYSLFFTSFFTILREGVESVVFLFGIGNAAPESIPISGAVGIICGMSVGFVLYFSGKQVKDIKWLLYVFATVLFFIAAGSCENGADWLMQGGMFGPYTQPPSLLVLPGTGSISSQLYGVNGAPAAPSAASLQQAGFSDGDEGPVSKVADPNDGYLYLKTTAQPWWQTPMWDLSGSPCCGDTDQENRFLSMCKTLFGYNAKPCFIDALFYLVYWLVVLCLGLYKWHDGSLSDADYKYKRMLRKQLEEAAKAKELALLSNSSNSTGCHEMAPSNKDPPAPVIASADKCSVEMRPSPNNSSLDEDATAVTASGSTGVYCSSSRDGAASEPAVVAGVTSSEKEVKRSC